METINILLVADCSTIRAHAKPGTSSNPGILDHVGSYPLAYLISSQAYCLSDGSKPNLPITSHRWQTVVWSATCIALGTEYNVILQSIEPLQKGVVSPPQPFELILDLYSAEPGAEPKLQAIPAYGFINTVLDLKAGPVQYDIVFSIVDANGDNLGYYNWSPFIDLKRNHKVTRDK